MFVFFVDVVNQEKSDLSAAFSFCIIFSESKRKCFSFKSFQIYFCSDFNAIAVRVHNLKAYILVVNDRPC